MGWVAGRTYASRLEALLITGFTGLFILFLFQWGQYPYAGSYYLRFVLLILMGGAVFIVIRTVRSRPWYLKPGWPKALLLGFFSMGILALMPLNWMALRAHDIDIDAVEMSFPLKGGVYYISTGGSNSILNLHYKPHTPAQWYAIDIDRLDGLGRYVNGLIPDRLEDHLIFGEPVYSPCDGRVVVVQDAVSDHPPFEYDPASGAGNYVVIESGDLRVALLHLKQGSVLVKPGDQVAAGDPLGQVGNSGFSTQPHLHFQVSRVMNENASASQTAVPVRFKGRFLVRNSLFAN